MPSMVGGDLENRKVKPLTENTHANDAPEFALSDLPQYCLCRPKGLTAANDPHLDTNCRVDLNQTLRIVDAVGADNGSCACLRVDRAIQPLCYRSREVAVPIFAKWDKDWDEVDALVDPVLNGFAHG